MVIAEEEFELQTEPEETDEEISFAYDIATYPSDFTLSIISQMWKDKDISIPDYQREFVWRAGPENLHSPIGGFPAH